MTIYYIDPDAGSDVTGDGSITAPYRKGPSQSGAVVPNALSNTYRFKRGTVMSEPIDANFTGSAANEGQRVTYEAYGDGDNPPLIDVASAAAYCIRVQNKDRVTVNDFDLRRATNTGLQVLNNTTRSCNYFTARNVRAYSCAFDGISMTHAVSASGLAPSAAVGVVFDACQGHDNGQHGVAVVAYATGAVLKNCFSTGNSLTSSGWGVYQGGFCITYLGSSGWAISGNVKSRTVPTASKPYSVESGNTVGGAYFLTENVGTPTTPGVGEWGYSGTTVYVNIGVIASGYSINLTFQPNTGAVIEDSRGDGQLLFDGVGVGLDRGVTSGRITRCRGSGNSGSAVQVNQALNVVVKDVVSTGNREAVYMSSFGPGCSVSHVTSDDLIYGIRAERLYTGGTLTLKNNAILSPVALYSATISGTIESDYNAYTGTLSGVSAGANDLTSGLSLGSALRPLPGSSLLGAGIHTAYGRDIDGRQRPNPPSIGAYDVATFQKFPTTDPAL